MASARAHHLIFMAINDERLIDRLFSCRSSRCSFLCVSLYTLLFSSHFYLYSVFRVRQTLPARPPIEESCSLAAFTPPTSYEPKLLDDFHFSETIEIIFQEESDDAVPSYLFDAELDDETIGKALSSPLFIQERERISGPKTSLSLQ